MSKALLIMEALKIVLEILKFTIPGLVVFAAVYYTMKRLFSQQIDLEQIKYNKERKKEGVAIKLQAYERLALFCQRISLPAMVSRLSMNEMTNKDLEKALLISVQKEYEHNMVQQIYVSDSLWRIIDTAKNQIIEIIVSASASVNPGGNASDLEQKIFEVYRELKLGPAQKAISAIRKETELIL